MLNEMKKYFTLCAVAIAAIACQKQETFTPSNLVEASFTVGVSTKTSMDANGGMTWKDSDDMSVFTDTDDVDLTTNYKFTVQSLSDDSRSAVFTGSVTSNPQRTTIYAIYPHADSRKDNALTAKRVEVSYNGGEMNGDFVSTRFIMAGKGAVSGDDFSQVCMQMQQLTWVWDITIYNPQAKPIKAVQLSAAESIFPCAGTVDLTADAFVVVPSFYRAALQYNFTKVQTSETVLARFPIFPMEAHADVDLDVVVKFEDGTKEVFSRKAPAKATEAGKRYHNTYTLGQGVYDDMPDGYTLVTKDTQSNLGTIIQNQLADKNVSEVKIYLESLPDEAVNYSLGSSRMNPTKSIYLRSNPQNKRPIIAASAGFTFDLSTANISIPVISFKNVELNHTGGNDFMRISNTGIAIGKVEIDNCILSGYKYSIFSTQVATNSASGLETDVATNASVTDIIVNNSIVRMTNISGTYAFIHLRNGSDKVKNVKITNSTIEGSLYLVYCNMGASAGTDFNLVVNNNTFVNTVGSSDGYWVSIGSDYLTGSVQIKSNLFGGSMNQAKYNMLRVGNTAPSTKISTIYSNNYATSDWKSFTHSGKNGSVDILETTSTNAEVFTDLASFDLTLKSGTTAYGNNVGDPRWLSGSSAGLGDLEIEDTEY